MLKRAALLVALAVSPFALAEVSGTWIGSLKMDYSKLPKEYREQAKASIGKLRVSMTFNKDHTFTSTATGTPDGKAHKTAGTWKQSGNTITIQTKTYDGKAKAGEPPRTIKLNPDGKTMVMSVQAQKPGDKSKVQAPPSVTVVFTKKS